MIATDELTANNELVSDHPRIQARRLTTFLTPLTESVLEKDLASRNDVVTGNALILLGVRGNPGVMSLAMYILSDRGKGPGSRMAAVALDVARRLEQENQLSIEVVDLRSLRPLDRETIINSVKKTSRAIVFEEDWRSYGIGAEIAATLQEEAFDFLDAPIKRVASIEVPLPYSKPLELAALTGAKQLMAAIQELAPRRSRR